MPMRKFYFIIFALLVLGTSKVASITLEKTQPDRIVHLIETIKAEEDGARIGELLTELLNEYGILYGVNSTKYAECLMWCANICIEKGDNKHGKDLLERGRKKFKEYGTGKFDGCDTLSHIFYLELNAKLEKNSDRTYVAARKMLTASILKKEYFGVDSEIYLQSILDVSQIYAGRLMYGKSNHYHNLGYNAYVERIKTEFCSTSEYNRTMYWATASRYINRTIDFAYNSSKNIFNSNKKLAASVYNAMLLSKGLLLNTTLNFEEYINGSNNQEAINILQKKKKYIEQQYPQAKIDSLDYDILRVLKSANQEFKLPQLDIEWQDVASKLESDDLAIEFYKTKDGKYGAVLLKKDWKYPRLITLKQFVKIGNKHMLLENALKKVSLETYAKENAQDLWNLSKAVWTDDIVEHFPKTNNGRVYFAADGELLITAIENFPFLSPNENGAFHAFSDLFRIYRLSSTRQLTVGKRSCTNKSAAIYGGLNYDMYYDDMVADADSIRYRLQENVTIVSNVQSRFIDNTHGIPPLDGSQSEADSIMSIISRDSANSNHNIYIGDKGTEASFKALSGNNKSIIHIATHGYFYNKDDKDFDRLQLGEHPLNRSGLLFSGANNKWFGDKLPEDVDDGFLTALEISTLDFLNLDLVVLSACETGKGSIESDGVFGLQRGFKMAGVNSIIMSLWKVDDEATCTLMIEFYKNWVIYGMSKHNALEQAKQTLRSCKDKEWDKPYYWAAFILLDGVN